MALQLFDGKKDTESAIAAFLVGSFSLWVLLNIVFFATIDTRFLKTFFGTKTAPQYTCEYFLTSKEDFQRWDTVFENRLSYTRSIHTKVKEWIAENIYRWQAGERASEASDQI